MKTMLGLSVVLLLGTCGPVRQPPQVPPVTQPPVTQPPVTAPPIPPVAACPVPFLSAGYDVELEMGRHSGQQWDATAYLAGRGNPIPPVGWTGQCGTKRCALTPEKDTVNGIACTIEHCGERIVYSLHPSDAGIINWQRNYTAKVTMNPGRVGVLRAQCEKRLDVKVEKSIP